MRRALPLLLVFLIGLAGCTTQNSNVPIKVRDRNYRRIVSLSPGTSEILVSTLVVSQKLAGHTAADNWPLNAYRSIPVVGQVKPDYEKLKETNPDFIVYDSLLYSDAEVAKLKETKATVFGFTAKTLEQFRVQMFELANLLGGAAHVSDYIDKIHSETATATASAGENRKKVAVLMPGPNGNDMIVGTDSFVADLVKNAGGEPVGPKADRFVPLSPELLVQLNPDVIIVPANSEKDGSNAVAVLKDARFKNVTAVKEGHVGAILGDVLLRMGGRIDQCIKGLAQIINR